MQVSPIVAPFKNNHFKIEPFSQKADNRGGTRVGVPAGQGVGLPERTLQFSRLLTFFLHLMRVPTFEVFLHEQNDKCNQEENFNFNGIHQNVFNTFQFRSLN